MEIILTSGPCQQPNAFYLPATTDDPPHIVLCAELIDAAVRQAQTEVAAGGGGAIPAFLSPILFLLFHEVGHALMDVLDLPILGQEEDAADQLAVLILTEEPVMAMWAAQYWNRSPTAGLAPAQVFRRRA